MTILATAWGFLKGVPREVWYAIAAVGLIWFYGNARYDAGYEKSEAMHAEIARKAALQARKADGVAQDTVEAMKAPIEAQNEAAREAAKDGDDPLKAAFDSLGGR